MKKETEKKQTMKLNVKERVFLVKAIENSSTGFADRIILNAVKTEVNFDEKEISILKMQDVGRGGQTQTVWDRRKENKLDDKILYISKDRDRVLRKTILSVFKRMEMIVDGFEENIYKGLKWSGEDLKILSSVVDQMDKNEKITEANFPICKEIKDAVNSHGNENTGESAEHKENV